MKYIYNILDTDDEEILATISTKLEDRELQKIINKYKDENIEKDVCDIDGLLEIIQETDKNMSVLDIDNVYF